MRITPKDIFSFDFCPFLYWNRELPDKINPSFSNFEKEIIKTIVLTEQSCLIKDIEISPRKILRKWDSIWWTKASEEKISIKETERLSTVAALLFNAYCKYDVTDIFHPNIATNVSVEKEIDRDFILSWTAPIFKTNILANKRNLILVDFGKKKLSAREIFLDLEVQTKIYCCSPFLNEINYNYIYLNPDTETVNMTNVIFRSDDILTIERKIKYIILGIKKKVESMNIWNCERCRKCKLFKL